MTVRFLEENQNICEENQANFFSEYTISGPSNYDPAA